jgi:hypothetical protein
MIRVREEAKIENPREYEPEDVEHLRHLLAVGSPAQRDPQRENFFEIEGLGESFYVLLSPVSGNVVLVAKWFRQPQDCRLSSEHLVA